MKILKATLGARFSTKLFRISSLQGLITDAILDVTTDASSEVPKFTQVASMKEGVMIQLRNEENGHFLSIDNESFTYTIDVYETGKKIDPEALANDFSIMFKPFIEIVKPRGIRRLGYVCEHRFASPKPSDHLAESILKFNPIGQKEKFNLQLEAKRSTSGKALLDPSKDDFTNYIHSLYDSVLDTDNPKKGFFNWNLDVQRYYEPPKPPRDFGPAITELRLEYNKYLADLKPVLRDLGIKDDKEN